MISDVCGALRASLGEGRGIYGGVGTDALRERARRGFVMAQTFLHRRRILGKFRYEGVVRVVGIEGYRCGGRGESVRGERGGVYLASQ